MEKVIEKKKQTAKNDIILLVALMATAIVFWGIIHILQTVNTHNGEAVVTVDGEEYGRFPLNRDCTERIELPDGSYNMLVIADGEADMTEASCPDKICVNHRKISKNGQSIVCLPNRTVIAIENGVAEEVDAVTN